MHTSPTNKLDFFLPITLKRFYGKWAQLFLEPTLGQDNESLAF